MTSTSLAEAKRHIVQEKIGVESNETRKNLFSGKINSQ